MESSDLYSLRLRARNRLLELGFCWHCFSSSLVFHHLLSLPFYCWLHQQKSEAQPEPCHDCSLHLSRGSCLEQLHTENVPCITIYFICYCHNPTNNPKQLKTTFVGVVLLSVRKPHHTTTTTTLGPITIRAVLDNLGSWFSVCNLSLTQLDEIRKTTSIFLKMEDDLKFF